MIFQADFSTNHFCMKNATYFLISLAIISLFIRCDLQDPLTELDCEEIIMLDSDISITPANSENRITLTATINERVKPDVAVTFRTDYGFFENSGQQQEISITPNNGQATTKLVVTNEVSNFEISAQVQDLCQQTIELSTTPSLPHFITFQSDRLKIEANRSEQAQFTVNLFRNPGEGNTSNNIKVSFEAKTDIGLAAADLPEFGFSMDGSVTVELRSLTDSVGLVTITTKVKSADGNELTESLQIEFF